MKIITGYVGEAHITSAQDRQVNQGIFGDDSYVLDTGQKFAAEIISNNEIRIRDGVAMHQGCAAIIEKNTYDSLSITNGSQGMKRIDLVVVRYQKSTSTRVESMTLEVIQGEPDASDPVAPEYTSGDIQSGDVLVDMPLYHVNLDGITIESVEAVFKTAHDFWEMNDLIVEFDPDNNETDKELYDAIIALGWESEVIV